MVDVARPDGIGLQPELLGFGVGVGDYQMLRAREARRRDMRVMPARIVAMLLPQLAVALEERLAVRMLANEGRVVTVACSELDRLAVRAREPQRRVGPLVGLHV